MLKNLCKRLHFFIDINTIKVYNLHRLSKRIRYAFVGGKKLTSIVNRIQGGE